MREDSFEVVATYAKATGRDVTIHVKADGSVWGTYAETRGSDPYGVKATSVHALVQGFCDEERQRIREADERYEQWKVAGAQTVERLPL
jgi:hypothetical protein